MADTIIKQNIKEELLGINKSSSYKFENSLWPVPMEEEWRRTNLAKFDMDGFRIPANDQVFSSELTAIVDKNGAYSLLIEKSANGKFVVNRNDTKAESIIIYNPAQPIELNEANTLLVSELAINAANRSDNKLSELALSSFKDSLFILIPADLELDKPIILEFDTNGTTDTFLPNVFVTAGKNSQVKLIQKITGSDNSHISGVFNIYCRENTNIQTATVTDIGSDSLVFLNRYFNIDREAFLSDFQSCSGGTLFKTRTVVDLAGEKTDARLYGAIFSNDNAHIDMRTVQHHMVKDCFSQAMIKSVVKDKGRSIYQGLIEVEENAALTDAYLTNNNLVLDNGARADSIPSLKIRNNDVKCSHGSTTGKIDEEQILYLTSRGISAEEARQMILEGFFRSVYDQLSEDIKLYSFPLIMDKLIQKEVVL